MLEAWPYCRFYSDLAMLTFSTYGYYLRQGGYAIVVVFLSLSNFVQKLPN